MTGEATNQDGRLFSRLLRAIARFVSESSKQLHVPIGGPFLDSLLQYQSDEQIDRMGTSLIGIAERQASIQDAVESIRGILQAQDESQRGAIELARDAHCYCCHIA